MDFEKHLYGNIVVTDLLGARVRNLREEARAARRKEQDLSRLKQAFGILSGVGAGGMAPFIPPLEASIGPANGHANRAKQSVGFGEALCRRQGE